MGSRRGRRPTGRRRLPLLGVVLAAGLPLGGCAPLAPTVTTPAASASAATWLDCDYGRCATVAVPLDPAYPSGRTVDLAVAMRPATQPRKGAIFVHPGGPGVSGRARLATIDRTGLEAYDLISWDPRGVGGSAPLTCLTGVAADAFVALDAAAPGVRADAVTTADAVWSTLRDASQQFSAACRDDDAALVDHLSAPDQARDLETLRARLTGEPLRFLGVSEGARIGVAAAGRDASTLCRSAALVLCVGTDDAQVRARAAAIGREPDELRQNGVAGTVSEAVETIGALRESGVERLYLQVLDQAVATKAADAQDLLSSTLPDGQTVQELVDAANATIGEKIEIKRVARIEAPHVVAYLHKTSPDLPAQIGVLFGSEGGDDAIGRDVAMHIAAFAPSVLTRDEIDPATVEHERKVAEETAKEEGKPEAALPKIIEGRVNGFFKEAVLLEQAFAKDAKKSVQKVLDEAGATARGFARFRVGA